MMIIHTPAPISELTKVVGDRGTVLAGTTVTGSPDCFAGWYESADYDECVPNNIVRTEFRIDAEDIANDILMSGHQVVVTGLTEVGDDIVDTTMPYRYEMTHSH